jgi:hypothetical protein
MDIDNYVCYWLDGDNTQLITNKAVHTLSVWLLKNDKGG